MSVSFFRDAFKKMKIGAPNLHVVLGSGLSFGLDTATSPEWTEVGRIKFSEVPGLSSATVEGHPGQFRYYRHSSGAILCLQAGRLHGYEGLSARDVVKPLLFSLQAGTKNFLLTNAAGGLRPEFPPGSIMLISDHVNFTGQNPLTGPNPVGEDGKLLGPRFPDMSQVFEPSLRATLKKNLEANGLATFEGIYVGVAGPSYETPAEVKLFSTMGFGSVGMSTVWEAIALKHAGARICGASYISNYGCGLVGGVQLNHADVEAEGRKIAQKLLKAIFEFAAVKHA